jgi:hypothetical protein
MIKFQQICVDELSLVTGPYFLGVIGVHGPPNVNHGKTILCAILNE